MGKRFKNYGLWLSLLSLLGIILQQFGVIQASNETLNNSIAAILGVLVGLGVISNPTTDNPGYGDDKPAE